MDQTMRNPRPGVVEHRSHTRRFLTSTSSLWRNLPQQRWWRAAADTSLRTSQPLTSPVNATPATRSQHRNVFYGRMELVRMPPAESPSPPPVRVTFGPSPEQLRTLTFERSFHIGRGDDCEVCIKVEFVSRNHVQVFYENGQWWVRDQGSANGLFVNGQRLDSVPVGQALTFRLGIKGPFVQLEVEPP